MNWEDLWNVRQEDLFSSWDITLANGNEIDGVKIITRSTTVFTNSSRTDALEPSITVQLPNGVIETFKRSEVQFAKKAAAKIGF